MFMHLIIDQLQLNHILDQVKKEENLLIWHMEMLKKLFIHFGSKQKIAIKVLYLHHILRDQDI